MFSAPPTTAPDGTPYPHDEYKLMSARKGFTVTGIIGILLCCGFGGIGSIAMVLWGFFLHKKLKEKDMETTVGMHVAFWTHVFFAGWLILAVSWAILNALLRQLNGGYIS